MRNKKNVPTFIPTSMRRPIRTHTFLKLGRLVYVAGRSTYMPLCALFLHYGVNFLPWFTLAILPGVSASSFRCLKTQKVAFTLGDFRTAMHGGASKWYPL